MRSVAIANRRGFTLIELLVVLVIIGLLLSLSIPRYFHSVEKAREATLRQQLTTMRETIDRYYADTGKYPDSLNDLVTRKYIRAVPVDPITNSSATWIVIPPDQTDAGRVYNIASGAPGKALNGTYYRDW